MGTHGIGQPRMKINNIWLSSFEVIVEPRFCIQVEKACPAHLVEQWAYVIMMRCALILRKCCAYFLGGLMMYAYRCLEL